VCFRDFETIVLIVVGVNVISRRVKIGRKMKWMNNDRKGEFDQHTENKMFMWYECIEKNRKKKWMAGSLFAQHWKDEYVPKFTFLVPDSLTVTECESNEILDADGEGWGGGKPDICSLLDFGKTVPNITSIPKIRNHLFFRTRVLYPKCSMGISKNSRKRLKC
jgi:hypothetical protein